MPKETEYELQSRVSANLKHPEDPKPPAASEPIATVKLAPRRGHRKDDGIIVVSWEERALVARFLRLIRSNYWLSHFMKNLLRLDSHSPNLVPISEVEKQLGYQKDIEEVVRRVQHIGKTGWYRDHPAVNALVEEWDDVYEYRGDKAICDLIESAKKGATK